MITGDQTPVLLEQLRREYDQVKVLRRSAGLVEKVRALNQVLPLTRGEILAVFDADAQVPKPTTAGVTVV